jgi:hypothetical protein
VPITIPIRNIWIIQENGLCLVQDNFTQDIGENIDETIVGGFTAAIFNITSTIVSGVEEGIDSISIGGRALHYHSDDGIIVCLEVDKKDKEKSVKEAVRKIHKQFCEKYADSLGMGNLIDTGLFIAFKDEYLDVLKSCKILPKHMIKQDKKSSGSFRDRVSKTM